MAVIRAILLEIESWPNRLAPGLRPLHLDGIDDAVTAEHVHQLVEAGCLQAIQITPPGAPYETFAPRRLTSAGHDYLERLRASDRSDTAPGAGSDTPRHGPAPTPSAGEPPVTPPPAPDAAPVRVRYPVAVPFDRGRSHW